ncbi:transposase family protein [Streptomyces sp. XY332]|uniref:transposase family protein n=1 Tax=Streptomyces sp. XY332 TaxID=1415561 RepID=UPI00131B0C30
MIDAAGCGPPGPCPQCRRPASRIHSRYWRHVAALPAGGHEVIIRFRVRRFFCDQGQCRRRTFVEQVAGLTEPRLRASTACRTAMRAIAVELGGRPGQRLCAKLQIRGRRTTLLSQLTARPVSARAPRTSGCRSPAIRRAACGPPHPRRGRPWRGRVGVGWMVTHPEAASSAARSRGRDQRRMPPPCRSRPWHWP